MRPPHIIRCNHLVHLCESRRGVAKSSRIACGRQMQEFLHEANLVNVSGHALASLQTQSVDGSVGATYARKPKIDTEEARGQVDRTLSVE